MTRMVHELLGAAFQPAMRDYLTGHQYASVLTADFLGEPWRSSLNQVRCRNVYALLPLTVKFSFHNPTTYSGRTLLVGKNLKATQRPKISAKCPYLE